MWCHKSSLTLYQYVEHPVRHISLDLLSSLIIKIDHRWRESNLLDQVSTTTNRRENSLAILPLYAMETSRDVVDATSLLDELLGFCVPYDPSKNRSEDLFASALQNNNNTASSSCCAEKDTAADAIATPELCSCPSGASDSFVDDEEDVSVTSQRTPSLGEELLSLKKLSTSLLNGGSMVMIVLACLAVFVAFVLRRY